MHLLTLVLTFCEVLLIANRCSLGFCLGRTTVQARSVLKPEAAERPQPLSQAGAGGNLRFTPITTPQNRCRIFARHHLLLKTSYRLG